MIINLDLRPDTEHRLLAKAQAKGVSLHDYVEEILEERAHQDAVPGPKPKSLVQFFRESPLVGLELDLTRDIDPGRDIKL